MNPDLWTFEKKALLQGKKTIAGVDEAGRGPLAGPVVSAAVILPEDFDEPQVNDSKKLTALKRDRLYDKIYKGATAVGIGIVDAPEIDRINILQASLLSMKISVLNLAPQPDFLLIDGKFTIQEAVSQQAVIKGDSLSISIAAASIIAKVTRDRLMEQYDLVYPQFGFSKHKGYPTKAHKDAIKKYGACAIHRKSFKGVRPEQQLPLPETGNRHV